MRASEAAMPEPTLMPRYDADAICKALKSGKYREWQIPDGETITIHMKRQAPSLLPRMSPEDIESFCNDLKQGNVNEYTIPKHHKEPILITNIFGDE
ncbi:hypothetical protein DBV05_g8005 [Lasiodiplodia theobromae]|uniref:Uncharacterized protein n=1 Tax=Lasiodiplodia theobromae TaxID=45133 RepID=A0A5N5D6D6_9PEZI|nr:hypothetical protein DBV05_g8005 [Lasiodiplodia theobromae]